MSDGPSAGSCVSYALGGRGPYLVPQHVRPGWGPENQMASEASRGCFAAGANFGGGFAVLKENLMVLMLGEILVTKHLSLKRCLCALQRGRAGLGPRGVGTVQGRKARVSQAHHMAGEPTHGSNQACP